MKNLHKLILILLLGICTQNAFSQKITGQYWKFAGISSLDGSTERANYTSKVMDMFKNSKLFFDSEGDFEIIFEGGKTYLFEYEWKSDTKVLMLNFTGKDMKDPIINFLHYYGFLCKTNKDSDYLTLDFLLPTKSGLIDTKADPYFTLSFVKKQ